MRGEKSLHFEVQQSSALFNAVNTNVMRISYHLTILFFFVQISNFTYSQGCYFGGVVFSDQVDVNNFPGGCTVIEGNVDILGPITDLTPLLGITDIQGYLNIESTSLTSLNGLQMLSTINGSFTIYNNSSLSDYGHLIGLTAIDGHLNIIENPIPTNLAGYDNLTTISGDLQILGNPSLTTLVGLDHEVDIFGGAIITDNLSLTNCSVQAICDYINNSPGAIFIANNSNGCLNDAEVDAICADEAATEGRGKGIAVNTNGSEPDSSAVLDVSSSTQGLLYPRMRSIQRNAIVNPAIGLMVYDTDIDRFYYYNGTSWQGINLGDNLGNHLATQDLGMDGFEINLGGGWISGDGDEEGVFINNIGDVGIGIGNPMAQLAVKDFALFQTSSIGYGINDGLYVGVDGADNSFVLNRENSLLKLGTNNNIQMTFDTDGNLGVGVENPEVPLAVYFGSAFQTAATGYGVYDGFYVGLDGSNNALLTNQENTLLQLGTNNGIQMTFDTDGNVGVGITDPAAPLSVNYNALFQNSSTGIGSNDGLFVGVDGADNAFVLNYENTALKIGTNNTVQMYYDTDGDIGIGTMTPSYDLDIYKSIGSTEVNIKSGSGNSKLILDKGSSTTKAGIDLYDQGVYKGYAGLINDPTSRFVVNKSTSLNDGTFNINLENGYVGIGIDEPLAPLHVEGSEFGGNVGYFINHEAGTGIYAQCFNDNSGMGGYFRGDNRGVRGAASVGIEGTGSYYGASGRAHGGSGTNYGVHGEANDGETNYGVYGIANGGTTNYAGYFDGDVHVTGTLSKGGGSFKIDHPLDPLNKTLSHSFVESPDMMNIYNGNVVTNQDGKARIDLPEWFSSLNRDFRYQLTVIGDFAQAIVSEEVNNNQFSIRTDKPNIKVSWQVTGIRKDPYANAHRIQVEENKRGEQVGKYLYPAVLGIQPINKKNFPEDNMNKPIRGLNN